MSEPSRTRYAGFIIILIAFIGLLIAWSNRRSEEQILESIFVLVGAMVAWSIVRGVRQREHTRETEGRLAAIEQQLGTRLRKMEEGMAQMQATLARGASGPPAAQHGSPGAPDVAKGAPQPVPPATPAGQPARPVAAAAPPASLQPTAIPAAAAPNGTAEMKPAVAGPTGPAVPATPARPVAAPAPSSPRPVTAPPTTVASVRQPGRIAAMKLPDVEEMLGTNWLSKLGITGLVLGIAFLLAYEMRTMGPAGKVFLGYLCGLAMLGAGVFFERMEQYRRLARVGIAGAWPLLFFVTYAMYHVTAARIPGMTLEADLALMLIVAGAMVAHTLRYRSQTVTGLALLLAFLTITVNREGGVWSLTASVVLAMAVAVLSVRMEWYELEVLGILATYLNHFWWLVPIIEPMGRPLRHFGEFAASITFLLIYWAVFRVSYLVRAGPADEGVSSVAGGLNTLMLLALARYQSVYPELAWKFLLAVGGLEFVLGQLPMARRRRAPFILLSTIGVTLVFTAFPLHFSPENTSLGWVALAEALFFSGIFLDEIVFRRLAYMASAVGAIQLIGVHGASVIGERMDHATYDLHWALGLICAIAAAAFFFTAHAAPRLWPKLFPDRWDEYACEVLSWLAGGVAFTAVYVTLPYAWIAVVWMALGVALLGAANRWKEHRLAPEACAAVGVSFFRALVVNLQLAKGVHDGEGSSLRLWTLAAIALLCYVGSRWGEAKEREWRAHLPAALSWAGTGVFTLLAWYELRPASVALAWALVGIALLETGLGKPWLVLRLQAYALFISGFLRIFFVNLNAESGTDILSARLYTVVPMAVVFYFVYERLQGRAEDFLETDRGLHAAETHSWMGLLTCMALLRFELPLDWVVAAWAALGALLMYIAWWSGRRLFISQSLVVGLAVAVRGTLHNFFERSNFPLSAPLWFGRYFVLSTTAALLLAALPAAFRLRTKEVTDAPDGGVGRAWFLLTRRPEQTLFFVALLLVTGLLAAELRHGMVTIAWGLEAVVVFLFALKVGERSYRLAGLGLLLLCVAKIALMDFWEMALLDRALTLVVLGASLLGVSVLYTRHREAIRQYL